MAGELRDKLTILCGLDSEHLQEFQVSFPTWVHCHPELAECQFILLCGHEDRDGREGQSFTECVDLIVGAAEFLASFGCSPLMHPVYHYQVAEIASQREKMLTALALLPWPVVRTKYFLKIDTDTIATNPCCQSGIQQAIESLERQQAAIAAPPWGYTKPASAIEQLDRWAETIPAFAGTKPLSPQARKIDREKNRIHLPRIIGWMHLGLTSFHRDMAELAESHSGSSPCGRLPVPSHDTFFWYCAERLNAGITRFRFQRFGWQHCGGNLRKLREIAGRLQLPEIQSGQPAKQTT